MKWINVLVFSVMSFSFIACEKDYDLMVDYLIQDEAKGEQEIPARKYIVEIEAPVRFQIPNGGIVKPGAGVKIELDSSLTLSADDGTSVDFQLPSSEITDENSKINLSIEQEFSGKISSIKGKGIELAASYNHLRYQSYTKLGNSLWSKGWNLGTLKTKYNIAHESSFDPATNTVTISVVLNEPIILENDNGSAFVLPSANNLRRHLGKRPDLILSNGIGLSKAREI